MKIFNTSFSIETRGETDILDVTDRLIDVLGDSGMSRGILTAIIPGSTAGITTIEYEDGLIHDLKEAFEKIAPRNGNYMHNLKWHDGNGYAHVRASMVGQDITIPFRDGRLILGTWQQVILIDFDNRPRTREVFVTVMGE